jgi:hypothetical protein
LLLRYKAISKQGELKGFGQTSMISSQYVTFGPGDGLEPGMQAEIAIDWPYLLDGCIGLHLVLQATIIGSKDDVTEAHIPAHHFRTRRLA